MNLRRLSLLLIAALLLTPDAFGVRSSHSPLASRDNDQAGIMGRPAVPLVSGPRPSSLSPFAAWRYRLKSVLQESDSRIIREADLGPVPSFSSEAQTPGFQPFGTIVPLRC